jgi:hypothetical protein
MRNRMKGTVLRVLGGGAVAAVLMTVIALPASAAVTPAVAPTVDVASPAPGAYFRRGTVWVAGVACDPNASMTDPTAGIARVQVFAGDRDDPIDTLRNRPGGYLGGATVAGTLGLGQGADLSATFSQTSRLSLGNPSTAVCKNPTAGWRVLTAAVTKKGTYNFNVYVLAKNGMETKVTIPVRIDTP